MKLKFAFLFLAMAIGSSAAFAKDQLPQAETDAIVKKFQDSYAATFDHRDGKSMAALFTENATMQNEWGDVTQGKSNIEALVTRLMGKLPDGAKLEDTAIVSQSITPDVIVCQGVSRRVIPGAETQPMFFTRVLVHSKGKWLLSNAQVARPSSVPKPAPTPAAN